MYSYYRNRSINIDEILKYPDVEKEGKSSASKLGENMQSFHV